MRRWAGPGIMLLFGAGLEVSPIQDIRLSLVLWTIAIVWGIIAYFKIEPFKIFKRKKVVNELPLKIEHDENDDRYYYEPPNFGKRSSLEDIFDKAKKRIDFRLCRVLVRNMTEKTIKNVEVKLTNINPCPPRFVKGKLPTNLIIKDDRATPPTREKDLNPDYPLFVDVIQWQYHGEKEPWFSIQTSITGVYPTFPVSDTIYKIKIEAFGENARCKSRYFYFGLKKKDDGQKKLWMWSVD